jgi:virulence-associated protein VagC
MLAKKTVKNQITLPKAIASRFPGVEYFEVSAQEDAIVLRPLRRSRAGEVRAKLAKLGVREEDVADAVAWARKRR